MNPHFPPGRVSQRCVFYLSGFDPKGAAHYHALYRDEAAKQALISGGAAVVGPRKRHSSGNSFWNVTAAAGGSDTSTHYEFLRWDDIVRDHWPRSETRLWWNTVVTTFKNLRYGSLWRMFRAAWPPAVVLFVPFLMVCTVVLALPVASVMTFILARQLGAIETVHLLW